jgi:hypothetical protein
MENRKSKIITGCENVRRELYGCNSVAFLADLPRDAVVDSVIVNGKHLVDLAIEDSVMGVQVRFPRNLYEDGKRVAAVLHSIGGCELENQAAAFLIESFEVEYHAVAISRI